MKQLVRRQSLSFVAILLTSISHGGDTAGAQSNHLPANSTVKTIYVVASSHWNLGDPSPDEGSPFPYRMATPPEVIKIDAKAHLDQVLDTCLSNNDFYWTVEALWMFDAWWDNTPDRTRRELMLRFVREGRISLSAVDYNYRTAFLGSEEVNRVCYDAERLRQSWSLPIDTAVINDVPGWNWSLVQPLKKSGVKYFLAGPNTFIGGALTIPPKDMPFWWEGPDGSRVLTWSCVGGYTEGQTRVFVNPEAGRFFTGLGIVMAGVEMKDAEAERKKIAGMSNEELMDYSIGRELRRLGDAGYRYDSILVMYSHDAQGPDSIVGTLKHFRDWNRRHKLPRIVLSGARSFFEHLEKTYGRSAFPAYSGDSAGLWETANFTEPNFFAMRRFVREHAPALEKMSSVARISGSRPYPIADLRRINAMVLEDDDQGMVNGAGVPVSSYQATKGLYEATLTRLAADAGSTVPAIVVLNPSSWERSGPVEVTLRRDFRRRSFPVMDSITGAHLAAEKTGDGKLRFVANNVPSLGYKLFYADPETQATDAVSDVSTPDSATIENSFYRVSLDPKTGDIRSLFDKQARREMVDASSSFGLNALCDSPKALWAPINPVSVRSAKISVTVAGPSARLTVQREGTPWVWSEISLHSHLKRVDIRNRFRVLPYDQQAGAYFLGFPFALAPDKVVPRIENANAFLTPGGPGVKSTYLPGAYTGAFVASPCVDLHEGDTYGILLAQRDNPGVQFDSKKSTVFSKLVTKGTILNPSGLEPPREYEFDFAMTSHGGAFDPVAVKRFGEEVALPMWGDSRPGSRPGDIFAPPLGPFRSASASFLEINQPNVVLSAWKMAGKGDENRYLLRFQEVAGRECEVSARSMFQMLGAVRADMVENPLKGNPVSANPLRFHIEPNETASMLVRFQPLQRPARN